MPPAPPANATGSVTLRDAAGVQTTVSSVHASPAPRDHSAEFKALDRNGDGSLSHAEARGDKYLSLAFSSLDADHDGRLDNDEAMRWLNN